MSNINNKKSFTLGRLDQELLADRRQVSARMAGRHRVLCQPLTFDPHTYLQMDPQIYNNKIDKKMQKSSEIIYYILEVPKNRFRYIISKYVNKYRLITYIIYELRHKVNIFLSEIYIIQSQTEIYYFQNYPFIKILRYSPKRNLIMDKKKILKCSVFFYNLKYSKVQHKKI